MVARDLRVRLYRMTYPDGTSKDWAVPDVLDPRGLTVYFGRTGSTLRRAETPAGQCRDGIPIREAEGRIREKLAKGYRSVGVFRLAPNRRDLTPEPAPDAGRGWNAPEAVASPPPAIPALYWRLRGPAAGAKFEAAVRDAAAGLAAVGWSLPGSRPDDGGGALWSRAIGPPASAHGLVPLADDGRPSIAFLLLLARREARLSLADESGRAVTAWPPELPVEAAILEALGLQSEALDHLLARVGNGGWFY